jgi:thiamine-monophosphate kinase
MARIKNEDSLIRSIERRFALDRRRQLPIGMGDDAALFSPGRDHQTILTCDWFLEGSHFLRDKHPADAVGWKCLARAVSDIAAMGGTPNCFLLSLALPESHTGKWLNEFLGGLHRAARLFGCALAGGDTTKRKDILINVTVIGEVRAGRSVLRSGARPGDLIYVSGHLGQAELGLRTLRRRKHPARPRDPLLRKHFYPVPRLELGRWLAENRLATAMMDLSDGLSSDLPRLCRASEVGARVAAEQLPFAVIGSARHSKKFDLQQLALHGGEDYELLFTVARAKARRIPRTFHGLPLTPIGEITRTNTVQLRDGTGREQKLVPSGWDPFRR